MKWKILATLIACLPFTLGWSEQETKQLSRQAEAFGAAQDFQQATNLYQQLLSRSLPSWQQARILYNLGTLQLSQNRPDLALDFFQKVTPSNLSLPSFGGHFYLNQGIALLEYAQAYMAPSSPFFGEQLFYLEDSLKALQKAQEIDVPQPLIDQWSTMTSLQLDLNYLQRAQKWLEQQSIETLATFLSDCLLALVHMAEQGDQKDKSSLSYFQSQGESLISIWNALQVQPFSASQKEAFNQAASFYLSAIKEKELSPFVKELKQSSEALSSLEFQENQELQQAALSYELLLLKQDLSASSIHEVQEKFPQKNEELQKSYQAIKAGQPLQAHFYLLEGLVNLKALQPNKHSSTTILKSALEQANRVLQMLFLAELVGDNFVNQNETIFQNQQRAIVKQATPFIPAVLEEQSAQFKRIGKCLQSPWDQAIPLFDQGFQAAKSGARFKNSQELAGSMEQTILNWQQALALLLNPPQEIEKGESSSAPRNLAESYRLIQEMYLEDQTKPPQVSKELHSW